jgi:hypothetical protein
MKEEVGRGERRRTKTKQEDKFKRRWRKRTSKMEEAEEGG